MAQTDERLNQLRQKHQSAKAVMSRRLRAEAASRKARKAAGNEPKPPRIQSAGASVNDRESEENPDQLQPGQRRMATE